MNELFNSVTSNGYNYVTFVILLLLMYLLVAATIKVITDSVIKIILVLKADIKQDGSLINFDIKD